MPYINEKQREIVDSSISDLKLHIKTALINGENVNVFDIDNITDQQMLTLCGILNYTITRLCAGVMGNVSYSKIALITGVLENVKQEFYRRIAIPYEDKKIAENGDVKEYKKI